MLLLSTAYAALSTADVATLRSLLYGSGYDCGRARLYLQDNLHYTCPQVLPDFPTAVCITRLTNSCSPVDADADGSPWDQDCDETDASIYPGAPEVCDDGIDQDCVGGDETCAITELYAADALAVLYTTETYASFALAVENIGDNDGNGTDDLLVGDPYWSRGGTSRGAAFLFGSVSGEVPVDDATAELRGPTGGDQAGTSFAALGDHDGDGFSDFLLGAPGTEYSGVDSAGAVFLLLGTQSGPGNLSSLYDQHVQGLGRNNELGGDLAATGDQDADGVGDWCASYVYGVYCFSGANTTSGTQAMAVGELDLSDRWAARPAQTLAALDDFDGDGIGDLALGSYVDGVDVYAGPLTGTFTGADPLLNLTPTTYAANWRVESAGDLNGDGLTDLAMTGDSQQPMVVYGGRSGYITQADTDVVFSTTGVAAVSHFVSADLDADGSQDLLLGARGDYVNDSYEGRVLVYHGPVASGAHEVDEAGLVLHGLDYSAHNIGTGDFDGDGQLDIYSSTNSSPTYGSDAYPVGVVWVWSGASF